jgi:hypothetical protein
MQKRLQKTSLGLSVHLCRENKFIFLFGRLTFQMERNSRFSNGISQPYKLHAITDPTIRTEWTLQLRHLDLWLQYSWDLLFIIIYIFFASQNAISYKYSSCEKCMRVVSAVLQRLLKIGRMWNLLWTSRGKHIHNTTYIGAMCDTDPNEFEHTKWIERIKAHFRTIKASLNRM